MKNTRHSTNIGTFLTYLALCAIPVYMVIQGTREKPSIQVDHFVSGAGGSILLGIILLPVASGLLWMQWNPEKPEFRTAKLLLVVVPIAFLLYIMTSLERYAPDFQEAAFVEIVTDYQHGAIVDQEQVLSALGKPLSQELIGKRVVWSYTYMPSIGFGWNKRILSFDQSGIMIGFNNVNEP